VGAFTKASFGVIAPFLAEYGYHPIPIIPGDKRPAIDEWQTPRPVEAYLPRYARYWTGILTATCPAIDLDIRDKELVRVLIETADEMLGGRAVSGRGTAQGAPDVRGQHSVLKNHR